MQPREDFTGLQTVSSGPGKNAKNFEDFKVFAASLLLLQFKSEDVRRKITFKNLSTRAHSVHSNNLHVWL